MSADEARVTLPATSWRSMFVSHRGAVRATNEDFFLEAPDLGLWVIADGMGGHEGGQMASATIVHVLEQVPQLSSPKGTEACVRERVAAANDRLQELSREAFGGRTIGSTIAVLILRPECACCLWAGDSRIYRLRRGALERLTRDHSRTEELIAQGAIAPEQAETHSQANVITRAVGAASDLDLDSRIEPLEIGDTFLLCSDGLYRSVADAEMADILGRREYHEAAEALLALSLSRQPTDNVTLGVVQSENADITAPSNGLLYSRRVLSISASSTVRASIVRRTCCQS